MKKVRILHLLFGLILLIILFLIGWDAHNQEWKRYQKSYYKIATLKAQTEQEREWIRGQQVEIKQIQLKTLNRVDRCTTCHLGVENPRMVGMPEPFTFHPPVLKHHPPDTFGCTVCHGGQGRAVTTLEAHGKSKTWTVRLLKGEYMQASCYNCHKTLTPGLAEDMRAVIKGKRLINQYKCLRCHQVDGDGGSEGTDLSTVGGRRDWIWIYAHLLNPQAMSPGSTMPDYPLTRDEVKYMTIYLTTLLGDEERVNDARFLPREPSSEDSVQRHYLKPYEKRVEDHEKRPVTLEDIPVVRYSGKAFFQSSGCYYCHRIGKYGGEVGPVLTYIGRKRDIEWFRRLLREPADVLPAGQMPQLYLNDRELEALSRYLTTLK